jgi:hypothetical protein
MKVESNKHYSLESAINKQSKAEKSQLQKNVGKHRDIRDYPSQSLIP